MKFAFVTARYGADVTSGPDHACRLLAEQISARHDVEVLTTCARDARTWRNDYSEGVDRVRGALVHRFAVSPAADSQSLAQFTERLRAMPAVRNEELEWVRRAGPWSPALIDHIKRTYKSFDAIVFFSLLSPLTVHGLQTAAERSILVPYLQPGPTLRFGLSSDVLTGARALALMSSAERQLLRHYMRISPAHEEIVGVGIDPPPEQSYPRHQQDPADVVVDEDAVGHDGDAVEEESYLAGRGIPFRRRHRLYGRFALYGGRVEPDNGCEEMLEYFDAFARDDGDTALVLMGVKMMRVPEDPWVRLAGVLPDRERLIAFEAADVTIAPAADDLLAQPVLESLAVGTPVLASARNASAVEHCRAANGGLYYANRDEFVAALKLLATNKRLREQLGENGRAYIRQNYRWDAVLGRFDRLVAKVRGRA